MGMSGTESPSPLPAGQVPWLESGDSPMARHFCLGRVGTALVLVAAMSLVLSGLDLRTLTRHEVFAAQPAREMLTDGHWIVPTFVGEPRTNKPPGMMWLIAASLSLLGPSSELAARLPAALSAVALCWMLAALAARFCGRRIGILTGLLAATSYFTILQGRLAEADMPLATCMAAAMTILACCWADSPAGRWRGWGWPLAFHALAGVSALLKGVAGPGFVVLSAICLAALLGRGRHWRFLLHPVGLLLLLAIPGAWHVAAYRQYPPILDTWLREQAGAMHTTESPWHYFAYVPEVLLPWFPLALVGVWHAHKQGFWGKPLGKLMIAWFVPGMVILMAGVPEKAKHYPIPLLGPWVMLAAAGMVAVMEGLRPRLQGKVSLPVALAMAGSAVGAAAAFYIDPTLLLPGILAAVVLLTAVFTWMLLGPRRPVAAAVGSAIGIAWGLELIVVTAIIPAYDDFRAEAEVGMASHTLAPAGQPLIMLGLGERPVAWYARRPLQRLDNVAHFAPPREGSIYVLTTEAIAAGLADATELARATTLRASQRKRDPGDRLVLVRVDAATPTPSGAPE